MTGKVLTPSELADRQRNALAELEEFYGELRNGSRLARRALAHIHALVNELHDSCQLLAKYRQHVEDCESIDFLDQIGESDVPFTPAEVAALLALREPTPVAWKGNEAEHDAQLREYLENRND